MSAPEHHWVEANGKTVGENLADAITQTAPDNTAPGGTYTSAEQGIIANLQARVSELEAKLALLS